MKSIFFIVLIGCLQVSASSLAQINLNKTNASLKEILNDIRKQSGYSLLADADLLKLGNKVTLRLKDVPVARALDEALAGQPFSYKINNKTIVIYAKEKTDSYGIKPVIERVTGKVVDETGQPVIGATIRLKNDAKKATVTDVNGTFSVEVPEGSVLIISFIGYQNQEIITSGTTPLTIALSPSPKDLNEVVVVGYGTQKKSDVTGSVVSVSAKTIERAAVPNVAAALQGQTPGVLVTRNTGKPGGGFNISIRGISSINRSSYPLIVVDGIPSNSGLSDLNPLDIERIDILKDASATAIYGSRGAKGVVLVTTKRGKAGKTVITYDAYAGVRTPTNLPEMFNEQEYLDYMKVRNVTVTPTGQFPVVANPRGETNWPDLMLQNGLQMNHNVSASGGDEKTRFSMGAGFLKEEGNFDPEGFNRYSLRGNIDRQVNTKWKAGVSVNLMQNLQELGSNETMRSSYRLPPIAFPYDDSGAPVFRVFGGAGEGVINPLFDQLNDINRVRGFRTFGNLYLEYQPFTGLTFKSSISPNFSSSKTGFYYGTMTKERAGTLAARAGQRADETLTWVLNNQAVYDKAFGLHKFTGTIVQVAQQDRFETTNQIAENIPYNSLWYNLATGRNPISSSGFSKYTLFSILGRINYSYKDRYLLTATTAYDGSSRLSEGNKWGFFPSASLAWRISEEPFMEKLDVVNDLKLRLSYGTSGNDIVDPYATQATLGQTYYDFGGTNANGYAPSQLANKNLKWEVTREINAGLDYSILNGRIAGNIDVYNRKISDLLMSRFLPATSGWTSINSNIGELQNSGVEVGLNTLNIQKGKFSWRSDFSFDRNRNKILQLVEGKKDLPGNNLYIGQPVQINYDYVFDGIWQLGQEAEAAKYGQKPGQVRARDLNNDGAITAAGDRQIIGKRVPSWTGSIGNTFRYGNLDLYVFVYTRRGEQYRSTFHQTFAAYNTHNNQLKVDYWSPSNPSQSHFQPGNGGTYAYLTEYRKVDFTRVGNITLGYNVPSKIAQKIRLNNLRVYTTATNPFTFTDYEGFDPEYPTNNQYGSGLSAATYMFGVNVAF